MTREDLTAADDVQLTRLLHEMYWRLDHGRADTIYELFTEDAVIQQSPWTDPIVGRDAIHQWGRERKQWLEDCWALHAATNLRFVPDGSDRARGTFTLAAYAEKKLDPARTAGNPIPGYVMDGELAGLRTAEGWRFSAMSCETRFEREGHNQESPIPRPVA